MTTFDSIHAGDLIAVGPAFSFPCTKCKEDLLEYCQHEIRVSRIDTKSANARLARLTEESKNYGGKVSTGQES